MSEEASKKVRSLKGRFPWGSKGYVSPEAMVGQTGKPIAVFRSRTLGSKGDWVFDDGGNLELVKKKPQSARRSV